MERYWLPVVGWEHFYEVSDEGDVRRVGASRFLKPQAAPNGYLTVNLSRPGRTVRMTVHGIVAAAWLGPRPEGFQVAHLNGVRSDNRGNNLVYASALENSRHKDEHGTLLRGERHPRAKLTAADVEWLRANTIPGDPECGFVAMGKRFGVRDTTIERAVRGRYWADQRAAERVR
jgi:hypothetical protein